MTSSAFVVLATLLVMLRFHRLNVQLRTEVRERENVQRRLQRSEEQYRLLVDNAPLPVVIIGSSDGCIRFMNPFAARKLGGQRQHLTGMAASAFYAEPGDCPLLRGRTERVGQVHAEESRLQAYDGTRFWADLSVSPVTYRDEECLFVVFVDVTARKERETGLQKLAHTDPLTGLWNRRKFVELATLECARVGRSGRDSSLLSLDIDNFKGVNDTYGHPVGDELLEQLAYAVQKRLRLTDVLARIGGEEFAILLPDTKLESARVVAEKVRRAVEAERFDTTAGPLRMTVSVGCAPIRPGATCASVMEAADTALYRAKRSGRNNVASVTQPAPAS